LYLPKSRGAVIQEAGEQHAGYMISIGIRGRSEHRIDAGALQILPWTVAQLNPAGLNDQVVVRRSNIDPSRFDGFSVLRTGSSQGARTIDEVCKDLIATWSDVDGHKDSCRKIGRETNDNFLNGFESTCGGADHDNVTASHR
jgi:hypothetical protein